MKAKSIISFVLVLAIIAGIAYVTAFDVSIGSLRVPSIFDKDLGIRQGLDLVGGSILVFAPDLEENQKATASDMDAAEEVIRRRLEGQGYFDASISREGDNNIRVEIPNVADSNQAVEIIGATAKLQFVDADNQEVMTGSKDFIKSAEATYGAVDNTGNNQGYYVLLTLTEQGRSAFKTATEKAIAGQADNKNYISIVLDDQIQMSPTVEEVIDSETCIIRGNYTAEEAKNVASLINSGQLPFGLKVVENRSVGATLGEGVLETSLKAALIGIILVMLLMLLFYRLPGLVSDISLVAYITVFCLILAGFYIKGGYRITLTLPGIAGVILSIGMAVDANVVIFERIKEELNAGKTVRAAVDAGFHRALSAVIDSNITTVIAAVVLYIFGTGTIKGFAVTLFIGVVLSMLTAISLTRFLLRQIVGFGVKNPTLYGASLRKEDKQNA